MATPARIREEARLADEQLREIAAGANQDVPPSDPTPDAPAPTLDDRFSHNGEHPNRVPPADDPTPEQPSDAISAADFAKLQRENDSLKGRLQQQTAAQNETATRLAQLERMVALRAQAETPTPAAPTPPPKLVTAADIEEIGDDIYDFVKKTIRDETGDGFRAIMDQLQKLGVRVGSLENGSKRIDTIEASVHQSADDRFAAEMNRLVTDAAGNPDWESINTSNLRGDNRFLDWLSQTGEDSDEPRQAVLVRARARNDAAACARMFNKFKREVGLPSQEERVAPAPQRSPADALVSPSPTAPSSPASNRGRPRSIPMSEITAHYDAKIQKRWVGREAEWAAKSAEYDKAMLEGRVTNN